jgi:hypothetical protein
MTSGSSRTETNVGTNVSESYEEQVKGYLEGVEQHRRLFRISYNKLLELYPDSLMRNWNHKGLKFRPNPKITIKDIEKELKKYYIPDLIDKKDVVIYDSKITVGGKEYFERQIVDRKGRNRMFEILDSDEAESIRYDLTMNNNEKVEKLMKLAPQLTEEQIRRYTSLQKRG